MRMASSPCLTSKTAKPCSEARWLQVTALAEYATSVALPDTDQRTNAETNPASTSICPAGAASAIGWVEEHEDDIIPADSLCYQARTARFCPGPVSAMPAPGAAPRPVYASSKADHGQLHWPVLPKRLDMMCVASGSALSIATFGLFPLAGLDVSPVANKPNSQSHVNILQVGWRQRIIRHVQQTLNTQTGLTTHVQCRPQSRHACSISTCYGLRTDREAAQVRACLCFLHAAQLQGTYMTGCNPLPLFPRLMLYLH